MCGMCAFHKPVRRTTGAAHGAEERKKEMIKS
jgi:hypothetical protein